MRRLANTCCMALGLIASTGQATGVTTMLTDPTRPYSAGRHEHQQTRAAGTFVLNSTLVSSQRRVAVINGLHVTEGETIGGATVIEIQKQYVLLQAPDKRITLNLLPDIVNRKP